MEKWKTSELKEIHNICSNKKDGQSWNEIAEILNEKLNREYDESAYRKCYQSFYTMFEAIKDEIYTSEHIKLIDAKKDELYKEKQKVRDWNRQKNKTLREESRIEEIISAIKEVANSTPFLDVKKVSIPKGIENKNEAVLCLSDWHIGDYFKNFRGSFNCDVAKSRVEELLVETIKYCKVMGVKKLNVLDMGDMIEGLIHVTARIQNELDAIEQIKYVSELLYFLLNELGNNIEIVTLRHTLDNHSRITPNFKEHIEKESFSLLIHWYLEEKLKNSNVLLLNDNIDENIGFFKLGNGKNVYFAHGHLENINTVLQTMTFGCNQIADYVFLGHWHTAKAKEFLGKKVYINGSLKGTDTYALSKRLFGNPSQTLLVFDGLNEIDIRINLH